MKKFIFVLLTLLTFSIALFSGCTPQTGSPGSTASSEIKVGVNPVPGGEIMGFVRDKLAKPEGLIVKVIEFADYIQPNIALSEGQIDANLFQHVPYMEDFGKEHKIDLVAVTPVLVAPLGIYSSKLKSIAELPDRAIVALPNDATNLGRALNLLQAQNLIKLKSGTGVKATFSDVEQNPRNIRFKELEAAQIPRSLPDVALGIINSGYAMEAGLKPSKDALVLEPVKDNPYANVLATLRSKVDDPNIQKLAKLLHRSELRDFLNQKYEGSVIPVF